MFHKKFPEDGTLVPKLVGVRTCHELYVLNCVCWLMYQLNEREGSMYI